MNGRNRSRNSSRTQRKPTASTYQVTRHRQRSTRYDRQRHATRHREWVPLQWVPMHRYNVGCLSVGGCF